MENETIRNAACVEPVARAGARAPRHRDAPRAAPTARQTGPAAARAPYTARTADAPGERPPQPVHPFGSVVCANDRTITDGAARHQAARIASPDATVKLVPTAQLTQHGPRALQGTCDGYDLLALGGGAAAFTALEYAPIPILIARLCPLGVEVTDTVVVAVDQSPATNLAAEVAGVLAAANGRTVTIVAAPSSDAAFERAIAASFRVLLRATGTIPRVYGEPRPPERTIPSAAASLGASLVVLGSGRSQSERRRTALIAGAIGCSVLVVPAPEPIRTPTASGAESRTEG